MSCWSSEAHKHLIIHACGILVVNAGSAWTVFLSQVLADCSVHWWWVLCSPRVATSFSSEPYWWMEPWVFSSEPPRHLRGGSFFYSKLLNAIFLLKMNCLILDMAVCVCVYTRISINFSLSQQPKSISWKWIVFVLLLVSTCIFSHLNLSISDQIILSSWAPALISFPITEIDHHQFRSTSTFTLLFHSKIYSVNHTSAWVCLLPVFLSLTKRKYVINAYSNVISS